jgi:hypothetical protein
MIRRTRFAVSAPRLWHLASIVALCVLAVECGGGTNPTAPADLGSAAFRTVTVTFRVYNSTSGEIAASRLARTSTGDVSPIEIRLSEIAVAGVDPLRAAVYEAHAGSEMGAFVTSTTNGVFKVARPPRDTVYDVFLMSTAGAANYTCLDAGWQPSSGWTRRYSTLRLAAAGEQVLGQPIADWSDESFRFFTGEFSRALNPFGLQYGRVDFVANAAADMTGGWSGSGGAPAAWDRMLLSAPGQFVVDITARDFESWYRFQPRMYAWYWIHIGGSVVVHGLAHSYLSAPDYWDNQGCTDGSGDLACLLVACPPSSSVFYQATPPLTAAGQDAVRYWALMNGRLR